MEFLPSFSPLLLPPFSLSYFEDFPLNVSSHLTLYGVLYRDDTSRQCPPIFEPSQFLIPTGVPGLERYPA